MLPPRLLLARLSAGAVVARRGVRGCSMTREAQTHKLQLPVLIAGVSDQGDGIGVLRDGLDVPVHVPFALPGEEIVVELWDRDLQASRKWKSSEKEPKWPVFGQKVATIMPSEHRTLPRCEKFFGSCGGCKLQHLRYNQQLQEKQRRIEALLEKAPRHSPNMSIRPIIGAQTNAAVFEDNDDGIYAYRNKMEFTCSTGRWLLDSDKPLADENEDSSPVAPQHFPFTIGLFPVASTSVRRTRQISGKRRRGKTNASWSPRILSIDECSLQDPAINRILQRVSALCEDAGLEAYNFQTHEGFLKQVVLRKGTTLNQQTELMIGFVTSSFAQEQSEALMCVADQLMHEFGRNESTTESFPDATIVSILQRLDDQALRHQGRDENKEEKERVLFGQSYFEDSILGHRFHVSFDSFFQPNTVQASRLYHEIQHKLATSSRTLSENGQPRKPIVWDLFCGVGSIGICMGEFAAKVYGFEIVEAAVEKARTNAELNGYTSAEMQFFTMDLTKRWDGNEWGSESAIEKPDIAIVDPPRAGLHNKLIKLLRQLGPPQICYVSCNPDSQVHDLELLCASLQEGSSIATASYEVEYLQPVDMLPHTPHIETVAWLRRRN